MKILLDSVLHTLPKEKLIIYENNEYINYLFNSITEYTGKKKTNTILMDDEGDSLDRNEILLITISDISLIRQYLSMSAKSIFKDFLFNTIIDNDDMFLSVYKALDSLQESLSDSGFIKLKKLMFDGIENYCDFNKEEISIKSILNIYSLSLENLTESEVCIVYLNMMTKINKEKYLIFNFKELNIDKTMLNWINNLNENAQIFIANNCIYNIQLFENINFSILVLKNHYDLEVVDVSMCYFDKYLFAFLPIISRNLDYLEEKIANINKIYNQNDQNILVKFNNNMPETSFT